MTSNKQQFYNTKDLRDPHAAEVQKPWFVMACIHAIAEMVEQGATQEQLAGAKSFRDIFTRLSDEDSDGSGDFPKPGLKHQFEEFMDRERTKLEPKGE